MEILSIEDEQWVITRAKPGQVFGHVLFVCFAIVLIRMDQYSIPNIRYTDILTMFLECVSRRDAISIYRSSDNIFRQFPANI